MLDPTLAAKTANRGGGQQPNSTVSTIRDICNGEPSELLELSGAVVRFGARCEAIMKLRSVVTLKLSDNQFLKTRNFSVRANRLLLTASC